MKAMTNPDSLNITYLEMANQGIELDVQEQVLCKNYVKRMDQTAKENIYLAKQSMLNTFEIRNKFIKK